MWHAVENNVTPFPIPRGKLLECVRGACKETNNVKYISRSGGGEWEQLVTRRQAQACLKQGELVADPVRNDDTGYWELELRRYCAGDWVYVTVAIPIDLSRPEVIVIEQRKE